MIKKRSFETLNETLSGAQTEEEVKHAYAQHFDIEYDTSARFDLYTRQVLFEFKYSKNLENLRTRAAVLAQTLYYVHRLKYGQVDKPIPPILCVADINETILTETVNWKKYYSDNDDKYDWDLSPSTPDEALIDDLTREKHLRDIHVYKMQDENDFTVFNDRLRSFFDPQTRLPLSDKKLITDENFEDVFDYWNKIFGSSVRNGHKTSRYFVNDIQEGRTVYIKDESKIIFTLDTGEKKAKKILAKDYEYFWSIYEKVHNPLTIKNIVSKIDRLTDEPMRRFTGEFFTPPKFAKKAIHYFEHVLGKHWWEKENIRLWDMAAGTGNLEWYIPATAYDKIYLSTLYKDDIDYCHKIFPGATCFQYDYLNDDINNVFYANGDLFQKCKLPENLVKDLANPKITWVIFINPPFATSQTAGTSGGSKKDVSNTNIRKVMHEQNLGEVSRELFSQFIFRINKEFGGKHAFLGLFSTLKYIISNNDQKIRDTVFNFKYELGFMFSAANFSGTNKNNAFPIGFLIWNLGERNKIEAQKIQLAVFDEDVYKFNRKTIYSEKRGGFLSKWIERPEATTIYPPFGGAITIKRENKDIRDRVADRFLGSLMCKGNDFQNQNFTALLSGPYASAGALSITAENFEKALVVHAVRRAPKATWVNDRDQFMQPNRRLSNDFITDCVVWSLFSNSNQTASMRNVEYKKNTFQIINHFFPFKTAVINKWDITDTDIRRTLKADDKDRFVASWLHQHTLSKEAQAVMDIGQKIYKSYFNALNQLPTSKYKIEFWDAGWWQIRKAMAEVNLASDQFNQLKEAHNALKSKLLPVIDDYGFI